jgi:hypothetical protein
MTGMSPDNLDNRYSSKTFLIRSVSLLTPRKLLSGD